MKAKRNLLTSIGIVSVIAVIAALGLPILTARTNCGGNSYALFACSSFVGAAEMTAQNNHSHFEIGKIGKTERQSFLALAGNHWGMNGADFLVKTNFVLGSVSNREVIIVSKRKFDNVPQPTILNFYRRNPAYAVGYSDGTIKLILPEQFANMNLTGFVSLSSFTTNFESSISKP